MFYAHYGFFGWLRSVDKLDLVFNESGLLKLKENPCTCLCFLLHAELQP